MGIIPDGTWAFDVNGKVFDYAAQHDVGYIVGVFGWSAPPTGVFFAADMWTFDMIVVAAKNMQWEMFGTWTDPDDGTLYVDKVIHEQESLEVALLSAVAYDQKAIYDLSTKTCIMVEQS